MESLEGRVALVTGGGTGIGEGVAVAFAAAGAAVSVCGRRREPLDRTAARITEAGGECLSVPGDVADEGDVRRIVDSTAAELGPIDVLVNNAGVGGSGAIHEHDIDVWDRVMAVNLRGPFLMCRAVLPEMRRRGGGHILNVSSEAGLEHYHGNGAYGVSKHALNAFSEYVQRENQDLGIRVDTICPGMVITEMSRGSPGLDHEKCLRPADIADLALWLVTRRPNVKIGRPVLIQTMENPWR